MNKNNDSLIKKSWLSNLRDIFSQSTSLVNEEGKELSKIDLSRNTLLLSKGYIDHLLNQRETIKESYNNDLINLDELAKANTSVALRQEAQKERLESILIKSLGDNTNDLKVAREEFKIDIANHIDLLIKSEFMYKQYIDSSLGRKRETMPQIDSDNIDDVILHFQGKSPNSKVSKKSIKLSDIQFVQGEINEDKVLNLLGKLDPKKLTPFLVAKNKDGYWCLDGHHRLSSLLEIDPEAKVQAYIIHLDPLEAIRRLNLMKISKNSDINKSENLEEIGSESLNNSIDKASILGELGDDCINTVKEILTKGKKLYAASIIQNEEGKVLFLKRHPNDDFHPSTYCLPSGGVEENENPQSATLRELEEETNLKGSFPIESYIHNVKDRIIYYFFVTTEPEQEIILDKEHSNYKWMDRDEWMQEDLILDLGEHLDKIFGYDYERAENQLNQITKAFNDDQISLDEYRNAVEAFDIIKANNPNLVKKKIWVTRGSKTFQQTVYVNPNDDSDTKEVGIGEIISEVAGMNIERYSDKAIIIKGDTYANKDTIKAVKEEIGVGSWNRKLNGWVFPLKFKDSVLGGLWSRLVDTNEEKAQAIQNQKNAAFEVGDIIIFEDSTGSILENVSTNEGIKYKVKMDGGEKVILDERLLSKAPLENDEKIAEVLNSSQPENRLKTERKIFGFKEIDNIHEYSLYDYAKMHDITQADIESYLSKQSAQSDRKPSPSVTRDKSKPSEGLTRNQIIAKIIAKHKAAVKAQIDNGVSVADNVIEPYEDLKEANGKIKKELSEEHKRKISEALKGNGSPELEELRKELDSLLKSKELLEKEMFDLYAKEREVIGDYSAKMKLNEQAREKRSQIPSTKEINLIKNKIQVLENNGSLVEFTDKVGVKYTDLPDFTKVNTSNIDYSEETILSEDRPIYIPEIDEEDFRRGGYILDMVKVDDDRYMVATNKHKEFSEIKDGYSYKKGDFDPNQGGYVALTLDQLVLTQDYYMTKKKAQDKADAANKNKRALESWFKRSDESRERYMTQRGFYESMPAKIRKKYSKSDWESMTWQEQEQIYQPIKTYGTPRLKNVFDDAHMASSFHSMYERFVDPEAQRKDKSGKTLKRGESTYGSTYAHSDVFPKWKEFREMISWKANDLRVQREEYSGVRQKALETSYGESNTNDILKDELGILVKRQNGESIKPNEIEQLKDAWNGVQETFGNLKQQAKEDNLKLSHAGKTYMYASKAVGVYYPSFMAIGVTAKQGEDQLGFTMGHEVAHWIDNTLGKQQGKRFASDNYDSSAGKVAIAMRRGMNKKTESKYINSIHECFARSLEQYHAIESKGVGAKAFDKDYYFNSDSYVNEKTYNEQLKPLVETFLSENKDLLKSLVYDYEEQFDQITKSFNNNQITIDQYKQAKESFELITSNEVKKSEGVRVELKKPIEIEFIEKSRRGVYSDNAQNRQLKRVGQKFGSKGQEEQSKDKQASKGDSKEEKKYSDKELVEHAKNASQADLERQIKESDDPKIRKQSHEELDRRGKEESVQEKGKVNEGNEVKILLKIGDISNMGKITDEYGDQYEVNRQWYHKSLIKPVEKGNEEVAKKQSKINEIVSKLKEERGVGDITLFHGTDSKNLNKIDSEGKFGFSDGSISFLTNNEKEAREYAENKAKYRRVDSGGILEIKMPKWAVKQNSSTGEFETEFQLENRNGKWFPTDESILKY